MPSNLQLPKSNIPRMPFSSPIDDDALSPNFATFSQLGQPWRRKKDGDTDKDQTDFRYNNRTGQPPPYQQRLSSQTNTPSQQRRSSPRPRLPELNLVTNFTKSPPKPVDPTKRDNHGDGTMLYAGETLQTKTYASIQDSLSGGMKGPVGSLKRSDSKAMEVSPSERTLVIGISIPSSKLAEFTTSPESAAIDINSTNHDNHSTYRRGPTAFDNPTTIRKPVIPRLAVPENGSSWKRRRAASSVYSQATLNARGVSVLANVPSIAPPPIPTSRHAHENYPHNNDCEKASSRITSWETEFDNDEGEPQRNFDSRPRSGESQTRMINRSSTDTIATRHRSQGWWNHILSPFLTRSNTLLTKSSPTDEEKLPPLPKFLPQSEEVGQTTKLPNSNTPLPGQIKVESELDRRKNSRSSIWTDLSRWDAERRTLGIPAKYINFREQELNNLDRGSQVTLSSTFEPFSGIGAAAEYFEACWHDQNSPSPFFECQNHICLVTVPSAQNLRHNEQTSRGLLGNLEQVKSGTISNEKDLFQQTPANRFSAAFGEVKGVKSRPKSDITEFEEDPDSSPEVEEARAAPVVRVGPPFSTTQQAQPDNDKLLDEEAQIAKLPLSQTLRQRQPVYSPQRLDEPSGRVQAALPLEHPRAAPAPPQLTEPPHQSPGIVTGLGPADKTIPLITLSRNTDLQSAQYTHHTHQYYHYPNLDQDNRVVATPSSYLPPSSFSGRNRDERETSQSKEKYDQKSRESKQPKFGNCFGRPQPRHKRGKRKVYCCIIVGLIAMIVLILVLALTLTRKREDIPVQSSFLNITGFPPIPTGVSTVARPDVVLEKSDCVQPATMWSCALPKELQSSIAPNDPDQPNFRIEIRFENGTLGNTTNPSRLGKRRVGYPTDTVSLSRLIRDQALKARDSFPTSLFTPDPSPPSQEDQSFLGKTTDGIATPFDGEFTPFLISFLPTSSVNSKRLKRQDSTTVNSTNQFPDVTSTIPAPDLNPDGTAAAANLLPFPSAQPLRLFNRGLNTEHYGFYNYFDRSIFLKSTELVDTNSSSVGEVPDDESGGSPEDAALVRCTWAQTRFLVQIWTNQGSSTSLLPNINSSSPTSTTSALPSTTSVVNSTTSSASDFSRPGSFPYPISISLDRHGGNLQSKEIYCYGVDNREHVINGEKKIQLEDRGKGGVLVNAALGPFGQVNVSLADGGPGGIDGGSGGCGCQWRNWQLN